MLQIEKYIKLSLLSYVTASCLAVDLENVVRRIDASSSVHFVNPCYRQDAENEQNAAILPVKELDIPNGSALNFAAHGIIGSLIRGFSKFNKVPNPLGLSHSGIIINDDPRHVFAMVKQIATEKAQDTYLSIKEAEEIIHDLVANHSDILTLVYPLDPINVPFAVESDGSVQEIFRKRILPYVHLRSLCGRLNGYEGVAGYDGNVYVRQLSPVIKISSTRDFMKKYIGRSYEGLSTCGELINSLIDANVAPMESRVFCSELAALFYQKMDLISCDIMPNNIIPEELGSGAGVADILRDVAGQDIPLKHGT
jgi:hypothetical protein